MLRSILKKTKRLQINFKLNINNVCKNIKWKYGKTICSLQSENRKKIHLFHNFRALLSKNLDPFNALTKASTTISIYLPAWLKALKILKKALVLRPLLFPKRECISLKDRPFLSSERNEMYDAISCFSPAIQFVAFDFSACGMNINFQRLSPRIKTKLQAILEKEHSL